MQKQLNKTVEIARAMVGKSVSGGRCFHLSAVFKGNKLLSIGLNNYEKSHPHTKKFKYHPLAKIHSELAAVIKLGLTDCSGLSIVNVRINNNNQLDNARPCCGCQNLIRSLNFKKVFYTNSSGEFERL